MEHNKIDFKKYIFTLLITAVIFATAIYISNYFGGKKLAEIKKIQDKISIDILSSETQFALLEDYSCKNIKATTTLSSELGALEEKLSITENEMGADDEEVLAIKRYYTLLQIKDYLLMKKISEKCKTSPVFIIYFYSNKKDCPDCQKEGYVLTQMRQDYPELRVYAFDYDLDLSALQTLISINKVKSEFPALVIGENTYYGFQSIENLEKNIPQIEIWKKEKIKNDSKRVEDNKI